MYNQQISEVQCHKHLGIILSDNGLWHDHINYIKTKTWPKLNMLKKLKYTLDRRSLEHIYKSFIRPILEYGDSIWDNCTNYEKEELNKIQNEAARIVTGATKLISIENLYNETCWETFSDRRRKHKLVLLYKMINSMTPQYLTKLLPQRTGHNSTYSLRNNNDLRTIFSRTNLYYNSFLPSAIREWNNLTDELRNAPTLDNFKSLLNRNNGKVPKYYLTGSRKAQILHTRLRTNCSSLNLHLFQKNISNSAACSCGSIESVKHYFFNCPHYHVSRNILLRNIQSICNNVTVDILLKGSSHLTVTQNIQLFEAVQHFILETKRFP